MNFFPFSLFLITFSLLPFFPSPFSLSPFLYFFFLFPSLPTAICHPQEGEADSHMFEGQTRLGPEAVPVPVLLGAPQEEGSLKYFPFGWSFPCVPCGRLSTQPLHCSHCLSGSDVQFLTDSSPDQGQGRADSFILFLISKFWN